MGKINNQERITWKNCIFLRIHLLKIGSFSIDDGDGSENATFKMDYRISNFVAFIPIRWKCLMWVNFPGVDFLGTAFKFEKRKKISSSLVYVSYRTWNYVFSRRSRAVTAKKCTKKRDARRANLLFCLNLYCCFEVLVAVAVAVAVVVVKLPTVLWKTQVMAFPRPRIKIFSEEAH